MTGGKIYPGRRSAAPRVSSLPLLSFDPGGIRKALPRRACPDVGKHTRCERGCQISGRLFSTVQMSLQESFCRSSLLLCEIFRLKRGSPKCHEVVRLQKVRAVAVMTSIYEMYSSKAGYYCDDVYIFLLQECLARLSQSCCHKAV